MKLVSVIVLLAISSAALGGGRPCKVCLDPNTEFRLCGDKCPKTCENLDPVPPCTQVCKPGCYCKKGFVRDNQSGLCILPCDCPKPKPPCGCYHKSKHCGCDKRPTQYH